MPAIDRTNSMNHILSGQIAGGGYYCCAGWKTFRIQRAPDFTALLDNNSSSGTVDGAVNATASQQRCICGINNGIDFLLRNVAYNQAHAPIYEIRPISFSFLHSG